CTTSTVRCLAGAEPMNSCERKTILAYILVMNVECVRRAINTHTIPPCSNIVRLAAYAETNPADNSIRPFAGLRGLVQFARSVRKAFSSAAPGDRASNEIIGDALQQRRATRSEERR